MSTGKKIPLAKATEIAHRFMAVIRPHVQKMSIAGSVRREAPYVGDIEIVCVEKEEGALGIVFGKDYPGLVMNGPRLKRFKYPKSGVQIELYITKSYDYGRILAIRTGSSAYSHYLMVLANRLGWCGTRDGLRRKKECIKLKSYWKIKEEYKDHPTLPPPFITEVDFIDFVRTKWIPPKYRNWKSEMEKYNWDV